MEPNSLFRQLAKGIRFHGERRRVERVTDADVESANEYSGAHPASDKATAASLRKSRKIKISRESGGLEDLYQPLTSFAELDESIAAHLQAQGFVSPTPVQSQTIPLLLDRQDCMVCAPTGTGKTLAYLLPIFLRLRDEARDSRGPRALVVLPTQELAKQVYELADRLASGPFADIVVGTLDKEANGKRKKASLIISTPMKTVYSLKKKQVRLAELEILILDEADLLLDLGLLGQTDEIIAASLERQSSAEAASFSSSSQSRPQLALLTATLPSSVEALASTVLKSPVRVIVGHKGVAMPSIEQQLLFVGDEDGKLSTLRTMMRQGLECPCLLFVESVERAHQLYKAIKHSEYTVAVIHASLDRSERIETCASFRAGKISILITTDLFARGLDFPDLANVINYDFTATTSSYLHRIGRTGRAGRKGKAVTFFTLQDQKALKSVVNVMKASGSEVPRWMADLPAVPKNERRLARKRPGKREKVGGNRVK